jgi:hypothetical protein
MMVTFLFHFFFNYGSCHFKEEQPGPCQNNSFFIMACCMVDLFEF